LFSNKGHTSISKNYSSFSEGDDQNALIYNKVLGIVVVTIPPNIYHHSHDMETLSFKLMVILLASI
jgi:hypothetical protein